MDKNMDEKRWEALSAREEEEEDEPWEWVGFKKCQNISLQKKNGRKQWRGVGTRQEFVIV